MQDKHKQILDDLDLVGAKHLCMLPGRNVVGRIGALVNGKRLCVAITKTRFGYFAAVEYDGLVHSKWSRTPSGAVSILAADLKRRIL